jgi:hypothetical protein
VCSTSNSISFHFSFLHFSSLVFGAEMEQGGIDIQKGLPGLPEGLADPFQIAGGGAYLIAAIAVAVLAVVLVVLLIWWAKRSRAQGPDGPKLPPKREAEEALERLQASLQTLRTSELAVQLSAVLRRCADRIWHTQLSQQTWHEHWSENGSGLAALPGKEGELLAQLLADCNALEFEPLETSSKEKEELLMRASDLIARFPARAAPPPKSPRTESR